MWLFLWQRTLAHFVSGSITVQLTSCLAGLDSTKQVNMLLIQQKQISRIQTKQTGQSYSDTSPYEVSVLWLGSQILADPRING